jgi:3-hydroxybutyryl-CoA dehydrogenase
MNASKTLAVLGFGAMGSGIVQIAAVAGQDVIVYEPAQTGLDAGSLRLARSLDGAVSRGKLDPAGKDQALARVRLTTDLADLAPAGLVIEAAVEDLTVKHQLLAAVAAHVGADTIIATNTSALSVTELAAAVPEPGRFAGLHFFNPPPAMPLVEVVRAIQTSDQTVQALLTWAADAGKSPIEVDDRPGFLVNSLFMPYINDVVQAYDDGIASAEDIDTALRLGLGYPMGPLELLDLIGLDVHLHATSAAYADTLDSRFAPPPLLRRLVQAGWLGKKAGRGIRPTGER